MVVPYGRAVNHAGVPDVPVDHPPLNGITDVVPTDFTPGTAAIREATSWARGHLDVDTIWAIVAEPNAASRRVLESNGFCRARDTEPSHYGDRQLIYELTSSS